MSAPDLVELSVLDAAGLIARGELSPVELTDAYLRAIAATEPVLNAYRAVLADEARQTAETVGSDLAAGRPLGPLAGIPLGLKDLYDLAGVPTTAGSPMLWDNVAGRDSTVAARLRGAGAVFLGKHSTHEFAWGGTTDNEHFGPTRNPHDHARIPGGSSGGSAASVVARTSAGSFGTDTCGSVRIPSALCGCVGFKPTYGRISLHRVVPLAPSLDHGGPLARTVADAALLYSVVAGFDPADARTLPLPAGDVLTDLSQDVRDLRVGRLRGWFEDVLDPHVRLAVDAAARALHSLGCPVGDVVPVLAEAPVDDVFTGVFAEAVPYHWARFGRGAAGYGADLAALLAQEPPAAESAARARESVAAEVAALVRALREVDVLICATVPAPAPLIGAQRVSVDGHDLHVERMLTRLTSVFDVARLPALSVPFGVTPDGLPIGIQVVGRHLDEATVLRVGGALERLAGDQPASGSAAGRRR